MIKLYEISYCGVNFGHNKWHSHMNKCNICKIAYDKLKVEYNDLKINWCEKCKCGCGKTTNYGNSFIIGHSRIGTKQTEEHKKNKINSWLNNGNTEKYSDRWKENNPSSSEKNKKRLREDNPATTPESRAKISKNNPMKIQENIDKIWDVKLERYGNGGYNNHEKWKKNFIEKYGVDNPAKVKEFLEKRIETYTTNVSNGTIESKNNWKCGYYIRDNGTKEWYDSSYELLKMKEYDLKKLDWTKKHGIKIPFIKDNGINSFYVPDFLIKIDNKNILVEIKGWLKKDDVLKAKAAIEWSKLHEYQYFFVLGEKQILNEELSYYFNYSNII